MCRRMVVKNPLYKISFMLADGRSNFIRCSSGLQIFLKMKNDRLRNTLVAEFHRPETMDDSFEYFEVKISFKFDLYTFLEWAI